MTDILSQLAPAPVPPTLYHYTTQVGLLGFIQEDEIWATHTQYLNDRREFTHALELVRAEITSRKATMTKPEEGIALDEMLTALDGSPEAMNVCVCSFSEDDDSLSQRRAYGGTGMGFPSASGVSFLLKKRRKKTHFLCDACIN